MADPTWSEARWIKSYDLASEQVKQFITLSTGIIALAVTFSKDVFTASGPVPKVLLVVALALYLLSIYQGTKAMGGLSGCMNSSIETERGLLIYHPAIAQRCKWQIRWFLYATVVVVTLVAVQLWLPGKETESKTPNIINNYSSAHSESTSVKPTSEVKPPGTSKTSERDVYISSSHK